MHFSDNSYHLILNLLSLLHQVNDVHNLPCKLVRPCLKSICFDFDHWSCETVDNTSPVDSFLDEPELGIANQPMSGLSQQQLH